MVEFIQFPLFVSSRPRFNISKVVYFHKAIVVIIHHDESGTDETSDCLKLYCSSMILIFYFSKTTEIAKRFKKTRDSSKTCLETKRRLQGILS